MSRKPRRYRLVVTPRADADLDEIADYIAQDSPDSARRLFVAAAATFEDLRVMPRTGRIVAGRQGLLREVRAWTIRDFRSYVALYSVVEDELVILRVVHVARDLEPILDDF